MIAEAIQKIDELVQKANRIQTCRPAAEPNHMYWMAHGKEIQAVRATPEPRRHTAHDIKSLADMVLRHAENARIETPEQHSAVSVSVWFSRDGIVALLDDGDRRDRITYPIKLSAAMKQLLAWEAKQFAHTPQEIRKIFRIMFPNTYSNDKSRLKEFDRLTFQFDQKDESARGHGTASIGKSIVATLSNREQVPENVRFFEPCFEGLQGWVGVGAMVETDPEHQCVTVTPISGEIESAIREAEKDIGAKLLVMLGGAADLPSNIQVYAGTP